VDGYVHGGLGVGMLGWKWPGSTGGGGEVNHILGSCAGILYICLFARLLGGLISYTFNSHDTFVGYRRSSVSSCTDEIQLSHCRFARLNLMFF